MTHKGWRVIKPQHNQKKNLMLVYEILGHLPYTISIVFEILGLLWYWNI